MSKVYRNKSGSTFESIQGIRKRPTYQVQDTIVWERWYFWRSEINIDYHLIQCFRGFCSSPLPIFKLSLLVPWIDSRLIEVYLGPYAQNQVKVHTWSKWRLALLHRTFFTFLLFFCSWKSTIIWSQFVLATWKYDALICPCKRYVLLTAIC